LILTFGPFCGAHFNPVVTLAFAWRGDMRPRAAALFIAAQIACAIGGLWLAHLMFGLPILEVSVHARRTIGEFVGEIIATFGLIGLILGVSRHAPATIRYSVAAYIVGAYWFTSSTSFANPAMTLARSLTNGFAGIAPAHVVPFILAELIGGAAAVAVFEYLLVARNRTEACAGVQPRPRRC
jgi:glycerol uptake facilitator-like aquaporin